MIELGIYVYAHMYVILRLSSFSASEIEYIIISM